MRKRLLTTLVAVLGVVIVGAATVDAHSTAESGTGPRDKLHLIAPASPGGGWDTMTREFQSGVDARGLSNTTEVLNVPGAGGTIGLTRLAGMTGRGNTLMATGAVMMGSIETTESRVTLGDVTPIARLADDYGVVVVPADSPYHSIHDLFAAWRADPSSVVVGGGSAGGTDHLLTGMLMEAAGVDTGKLNYIAYAGGGEVTAGILNGGLDVGVSSYAEFAGQIKSGELRALGLSAPEPVDSIDVPTFRERGVDVQLANWRGLVAPPGLSPEQRAELVEIARQVHGSSQWQAALRRNGWKDTFQTGTEFKRFVDTESERIARISTKLGLS